jgi:hypothetical protein
LGKYWFILPNFTFGPPTAELPALWKTLGINEPFFLSNLGKNQDNHFLKWVYIVNNLFISLEVEDKVNPYYLVAQGTQGSEPGDPEVHSTIPSLER